MQYPQKHSKTMVYAKLEGGGGGWGGGQLTECVIGDSKIEDRFPTTIAMGLLRARAAVRAEAA